MKKALVPAPALGLENFTRNSLAMAPWAKDLTDQQISRVLQETQIARFAQGAIICREGESAKHWIGVLEGVVKAETVSKEGRCTTLVGVANGGWLGEGSLLKREIRPYEIVALSNSVIALMPIATFFWLIETSLSFNQFLVHQLNARLGHFISVVASCRMQNPTAQVAVCLTGIFNLQCDGKAAEVIRISHEEVARLCGVSRRVAGRALHSLEHAGLLRMEYGSLRILNVDGLIYFGRNGSAKPLARAV